MPQTTTRPPTEDELKILKQMQAAGSDWGNDLAGAGCLMMLVFVPGALACEFTGILRGQEHWFLLLGIVVGLSVMFRMRRQMASFRRATARDATLPVEETTFDVTGAIKVEEFEDEGSNYYLRLADGGVLFLSGQYLYDEEEERRFPSSKVTTVRTSGTKELLDIKCSGEYIPPSTVLPPFSKQRIKAGAIPSDGDILSIPFETLSSNVA